MSGVINPIGYNAALSGIVVGESYTKTKVNADGTITINDYGSNTNGATQEDFATGAPTDVNRYEFFQLPTGLELRIHNVDTGSQVQVDATKTGSYIGFRVIDNNLLQPAPDQYARIAALGNNGFLLAIGNNTLDPGNFLNDNPGNFYLIVSTLNLDIFDPNSGLPFRPDPTTPGAGLPLVPLVIGGPITCFAAGTRIATPAGIVVVEDLKAGDKVTTASGVPRTVTWAGRRTIDCTRQPEPSAAWPVRVCAGAFGPGVPLRDLFLSRDHAIFAGGVLIPVGQLVNGRTIIAEPRAHVTYHHIELETHDVLLAEGLPCESYLDIGSRRLGFEGGPVTTMSFDLTSRTHDAQGCAPLLLAGPAIDAVRTQLKDIADRHAVEPTRNRQKVA